MVWTKQPRDHATLADSLNRRHVYDTNTDEIFWTQIFADQSKSAVIRKNLR